MRVGGLAFASPVLVAAGPLTETGEGMAACAAAGAAGVVARTVSVQPARVPAEVGLKDSHGARGAMLNIETWSSSTIDECVTIDFPRAVAAGVPLIVSLG